MTTYRITISYIGTSFFGWQSQASGNTIQDSIEEVLRVLLKVPTRLRGASRTDTGVHAEAQLATFQAVEIEDRRKFLHSLNAMLPRDIRVMTIEPCSDSFHPIEDCLGKAYRYRLWLGNAPSPFVAPFCWAIPEDLNLDIVRANLKMFRGHHDFTSFCAADTTVKTRERTIVDTLMVQHGRLVDLWFVGTGFLKQMVRIMVGTLVYLAQDKSDYGDIVEILSHIDRRAAGPTAPAQGLCLVELFYSEIPPLQSLLEEAQQGYSINIK